MICCCFHETIKICEQLGELVRKEDSTLHSVVEQNPLEQRYFVIQFPQKTITRFINSAEKSSTMSLLDILLNAESGWTGDLLVADAEELRNNTGCRNLCQTVQRKQV